MDKESLSKAVAKIIAKAVSEIAIVRGDEPLDGDATHAIAKVFLRLLDEQEGNS